MVLCCVPNCSTNGISFNKIRNKDEPVTFHDFPSNPDLAAKWIKQINRALATKPMWFPRAKPKICSKHFISTDFKADSDELKPRCLPTIFGCKYIGSNPDSPSTVIDRVDNAKQPLIVKVLKPQVISQLQRDNSQQTSLTAKSKTAQIVKSQASFKAPTKNYSLLRKNNKSSLLSKNPKVDNSPAPAASVNDSSNLIEEAQKKLTCNKSTESQNLVHESNKNGSMVLKKSTKRKEIHDGDLIEIGPNTFLKINPDVIKVNKKQTPAGNTVLQFIMDQKLALTQANDLFPKVVHGSKDASEQISTDSRNISTVQSNKNGVQNENNVESVKTVQHILGHLVDTHVCKESCTELKEIEDEECSMDEGSSSKNENDPVIKDTESTIEGESSQTSNTELVNSPDSSFISKAPVFMTTNVPLRHMFVEKPKYQSSLKQKNRQIASLKLKIANQTKKIEELEDRCIVQERQLSYSFIKRLKSIRKNATKGDPCATYILEQIRGYSEKSKMRWSDSTLTQCGIWCRKAPYAYEYFKKAEFFKLPCLGTVKRFMKKHPEIKYQKKVNSGTNGENDEDESSSDFDFDESDNADGEKEGIEDSETEAAASSVQNESSNSKATSQTKVLATKANIEPKITTHNKDSVKSGRHLVKVNNLQSSASPTKAQNSGKEVKENFPIAINSSNLELQEIILPSGEVVQCYSSNICNGDDAGQYYIIPNVEQNSSADHEYSVIESESLPVILQNLDSSRLPQQEQLIFITNSTDQVECSETEVITA